ncbi:MAG TPA: DUF3011 domain-containing protein [Terriglobales bacterium]|nr:DUF3011 domain-containing protein [Terriglobales bacterium]
MIDRRIFRPAAGLLWLAAGAAVLQLAPPALAQGGFGGPGTYEITNLKSGKVMDLDRNDQTSVIQFSSRGTENQAWSIRPAEGGYYYLRNMMNGYALEAPGNENSTPVIARPFNGGPNQQWRFERGKDGNALITSRLGKTLDVPGGTSRDGARLQIYESNGDSNQRFMLRPVSGNWPASWDMTPSSTITCSSDDGRRHYCDADTRGGVRIARRLSGSPCAFNIGWGFEERGIWVDRGCRAEFETGAVGGYGGGAASATVTCSSDDGERHYCSADTRGGVQLLRQISGSPCELNRTWGYDDRGIWVDRGCRAEFQPGGGSMGVDYGNPPVAARRVTCSSNDDDERKHCPADTAGGVRLVRQISGSPCELNRTWGYDSRGIWVDKGCRAEFEIGGAPGYGRGYGAGGTITCASNDGRRNYCEADTRNGVVLTRQISGSPCDYGRTWGYDARGIWVDNGCRAEFQLRR